MRVRLGIDEYRLPPLLDGCPSHIPLHLPRHSLDHSILNDFQTHCIVVYVYDSPVHRPYQEAVNNGIELRLTSIANNNCNKSQLFGDKKGP